MLKRPLNVLISGGGIAGASLAFTLARQPVFKMQTNIRLIEKSPAPRTTGQAVDIRGPGNVMRNHDYGLVDIVQVLM